MIPKISLLQLIASNEEPAMLTALLGGLGHA